MKARDESSPAARKLGLPTSFSIPATRFVIPYVLRKNIVMIGATTLRSPAQMIPNATAAVTRTPTRGSVLLPRREPSTRGTIPSSAIACNVRGAAIMLPNADESVADQTPIRIRGGNRAISFIISVLLFSSSDVPCNESQTTAAK